MLAFVKCEDRHSPSESGVIPIDSIAAVNRKTGLHACGYYHFIFIIS